MCSDTGTLCLWGAEKHWIDTGVPVAHFRLDLAGELRKVLNVVENWNSANSFIFYSLVYINTLMFQDVLADPAWLTRMTIADLRALTPLIYQHVNPYGLFPLDLQRRLAFAHAA